MNRFSGEQKALFLNYLDEHFFSSWRNSSLYPNSLELIISPICNTKCTYCYYNNYSQYTYPAELAQKDKILENCKKLFTWLELNNYYPNMEIFSGEFFNLPYYKEILEIVGTYRHKQTLLSIPTNATFCFSEEKTQEIQGIIDYYRSKNIYLYLSLSVDGKYLDNTTRPLKNGKQYDDEYYDRLFKFAAKNNLNFHPMISSQGIKYWKENLDWYVENIQKYFKISEIDAYEHLYFLEVRNSDWSKENLEDLESFSSYFLNKALSIYRGDNEKFFFNFLERRFTNWFSSCFGKTGRGLGCSIQQCLMIRMGDLSLVNCHRTAYEELNAGILSFNNEDIDIDLKNSNLYMLVHSFDAKNGVKCCDCPINEVCSQFCLGNNYEVTRDLFLPHYKVCQLEFIKIKSIVKFLLENNIYDMYIQKIDLRKRLQINDIKKYIMEEKC